MDAEQAIYETAAKAAGWFDTGHRGHATRWPMFANPSLPNANGFARDWKDLCETYGIEAAALPASGNGG